MALWDRWGSRLTSVDKWRAECFEYPQGPVEHLSGQIPASAAGVLQPPSDAAVNTLHLALVCQIRIPVGRESLPDLQSSSETRRFGESGRYARSPFKSNQLGVSPWSRSA